MLNCAYCQPRTKREALCAMRKCHSSQFWYATFTAQASRFELSALSLTHFMTHFMTHLSKLTGAKRFALRIVWTVLRAKRFVLSGPCSALSASRVAGMTGCAAFNAARGVTICARSALDA